MAFLKGLEVQIPGSGDQLTDQTRNPDNLQDQQGDSEKTQKMINMAVTARDRAPNKESDGN